MNEPAKTILASATGVLRKHPLYSLAGAAVIAIVFVALFASALTGFRYSRQDRKVEKLETKVEKAVTGMNGAIDAADQAAQERATEDEIRRQTIKPEIDRTARNLEEARARTRKARENYEATKKRDLDRNSDLRNLHQRNCSDLRELYPDRPSDLCK